LKRHRKISAVISFSLFVSFLLLFFVSLSSSIIKSIYFLSIHGASDDYKNGPLTSVAIKVTFGMWGYCTLSELGQTKCSSPHLGYDISDAFIREIGSPGVLHAALKALSAVIILHVICCALTFFAFLSSIFVHIHALAVCACIISIVDAIFTTVICAIDIAIAAVVKSKGPSLSKNLFVGGFGPAVEMTIVATVLQWSSVILLCMVICSCLHLG
ncbi:hypothetical protein BD410DRAFT_690383, partial [Rickenella mellea]